MVRLRCKLLMQTRPAAFIHENVDPFPVELLDQVLGYWTENSGAPSIAFARWYTLNESLLKQAPHYDGGLCL